MAFPKPEIKPLPDFIEIGEVKENPTFKPVRDFQNIDDLIKEINIPKEVIAGPAEMATEAGSSLSNAIPGMPVLDTIRPPMTPEEAARNGVLIAKTLDTGIGYGFSAYALEKENPQKYKAKEGELKELGEAWGQVSQDFNIRFSPVYNLLLLYFVVYGPNAMHIKEDRRLNKMKERQDIQEQKHSELETIVLEQKKMIEELTKQISEIQKAA